MKVYESPHRDRSPRLCECGFVLPLLPPVGHRLINNGNAAALLKCQLAARRHRIIFVTRSLAFCHAHARVHVSRTNCAIHLRPPFAFSPGGRPPGSDSRPCRSPVGQSRISIRRLQTVAQKAGGERQPQGFAAGSQQTEERNPDWAQWGGATRGGDGRHALPNSVATTGRLGQKANRPDCSLRRPR